MKKILVLLLTVVMLFTLGTITAFATETAEETTNVAKIGETEYASLADAVNAAQAGDTIALIADIALSENVVITGKAITLDLNGYTISATVKAAITIGNSDNDTANVIITDTSVEKTGTITNTMTQAVVVQYGAELTINGGTIESTNINGYTVRIYDEGSVLTINDGTIKGVICVSGNGSYDGTTTIINGGNFISSSIAIEQRQDGVLQINGGYFEAPHAAVYVKSGSLEITGGEFITTYVDEEGKYGKENYVFKSGNVYAAGETIIIENVGGAGYQAVSKVSITGGKFTAAGGTTVVSYVPADDKTGNTSITEEMLSTERVDSFITGGTFNTTVDSTLCAEGLTSAEGEDGSFSIVDAVAKIGDVKYYSLQSAVDQAVIDAENAYQTIVLLCDIELDETIVVTGGGYIVRFDLNGHNIVSHVDVVIENNSYIGFTNSGARASVTTTVAGGTVIQNNAMFTMMGANNDTVIGDGTGYAIKSADYEMFYGMCDLCSGTFDGEIEILSDINIMTGISGGVYTSDPTPYLMSNNTVVKGEDGTYGVEDKVTLSEIFTYKGYSKNETDAGITTTYTVNHEKLDAYERQNGITVEFGAVFAIDAIDENAVEYSLSSLSDTATYNIKINDISEDGYDVALIMTMYVDVGEGKQYVTGNESNATVFVDAASVAAITYNQVTEATTAKEEE